MARRRSTEENVERPVGKLRAAGFVLTDPVARRYTRRGKEVSYRTAFLAATGRSLEKASKKGKFIRTTEVAKQIRDAAREGKLSDARLLDPAAERRLARRTVHSLMKGHTFRSSLKRGLSSFRRGELPAVERRSPFGKLLGILHEGESGGSLPPKATFRDLRLLDERRYLKRRNPTRYRRLFGADSRKARLLVAMGRREATATYDVGDTP